MVPEALCEAPSPAAEAQPTKATASPYGPVYLDEFAQRCCRSTWRLWAATLFSAGMWFNVAFAQSGLFHNCAFGIMVSVPHHCPGGWGPYWLPDVPVFPSAAPTPMNRCTRRKCRTEGDHDRIGHVLTHARGFFPHPASPMRPVAAGERLHKMLGSLKMKWLTVWTPRDSSVLRPEDCPHRLWVPKLGLYGRACARGWVAAWCVR